MLRRFLDVVGWLELKSQLADTTGHHGTWQVATGATSNAGVRSTEYGGGSEFPFRQW